MGVADGMPCELQVIPDKGSIRDHDNERVTERSSRTTQQNTHPMRDTGTVYSLEAVLHRCWLGPPAERAGTKLRGLRIECP